MPEDTTSYFIGTLEKTPKIAALIGEFVAAWGMLEHTMRLVLVNVLSMPFESAEAILYAVRNTSAKIDILSDLTRRGNFTRKAELLDALAEISRLSSKRNALLHGLLAVGPSNGVVIWDFRYSANDPERSKPITDDYLSELIMEVTDAYNFLALALHSPDQQPPPWRSKYFQQRPEPGKGSKRRRERLGRKRQSRL